MCLHNSLRGFTSLVLTLTTSAVLLGHFKNNSYLPLFSSSPSASHHPFPGLTLSTSCFSLFQVQTHLRNVVGLVPDHHNKISIKIKWVTNVFVCPSAIKVPFTLCTCYMHYILRSNQICHVDKTLAHNVQKMVIFSSQDCHKYFLCEKYSACKTQ